jgi:hypothetical protein
MYRVSKPVADFVVYYTWGIILMLLLLGVLKVLL